MDIRAGYKQTEIGVMPDDWSDSPIGHNLKICHGKNQKEVIAADGIYPILGTGGEIGRASSPLYSKPSVLIGRKGTIDKPRFIETPFWTVDTLFYSEVFENADSKYLYYQFCMIDWYSYNEASGVPSLNAGTIEKIRIPKPPTKNEEKVIAEALSDADALIESLEKLIEKKRQIKQGAMQELLTGKKRLTNYQNSAPFKKTELGFIPNDWQIKRLPEITVFRGGKAHEQFISELGSYICVNSKFISSDAKVVKYSTKNLCTAFKHDILMVMSDLPNGKALAKAFLVDMEDKYAVNQRVCALTPIKDHAKFLYYKLNRNTYFLKFDNGVSQTHLLNDAFKKCLVSMPPTLEEQSEIAEILSDMDSEVADLESKLNKARQIKESMMQELLTGRIRLV